MRLEWARSIILVRPSTTHPLERVFNPVHLELVVSITWPALVIPELVPHRRLATLITPFPFYGAFGNTATTLTAGTPAVATGSDGKLLQFDPQICSDIAGNMWNVASALTGSAVYSFLGVKTNLLSGSDLTQAKDIGLFGDDTDTPPLNIVVIGNDSDGQQIQTGLGLFNVRRLNQVGTWANSRFTADPLANASASTTVVLMVVSGVIDFASTVATVGGAATVGFLLSPTLNSPAGGADGTLVIPTFESNFATTPSPAIPEIDIKIESIAVTAVTRKLRARWSPELAQDLNAYHSLDAEVELTQILSEQVALELDREILNDLLTQAKTNYYWSRAPGNFVNKKTGAAPRVSASFTGTVREWYETLIETVIDVANEIHRLTLRGSANFMVVSPDVATILEASVLYRPKYTLDGDGQVGAPMSLGAEAVGTLSNRFTVYKDPYFPRNKILVGLQGRKLLGDWICLCSICTADRHTYYLCS